MKVLVTGSSGHLGEALVRTLQAQGREVVGADILPSPYTSHLGSMADRDFVRACMGGVDVVMHTATLHKPHVATHSRQDFVDTNVTGTLNLLEEAAAAARVKAFVYTSTTSVFGDALVPQEGQPAVWITEDVIPVPKNIYGVTKTAAEDLCQLFARNQKLPVIILRTSRFFPEPDDNKAASEAFEDANLKANEYLHRRVDIEDVVSAHLLAAERAADIRFGKYIISATSPFGQGDLIRLRYEARAVVAHYVPAFEAEYARRGWRMADDISRVYVNHKALRELGWQPKHDFASLIARLEQDDHHQSELARQIGVKGYHDDYRDGLYPVE